MLSAEAVFSREVNHDGAPIAERALEILRDVFVSNHVIVADKPIGRSTGVEHPAYCAIRVLRIGRSNRHFNVL
ncbi:MAG: hypothetical protein JO111_07195 [Caulobacteraceae bacterium]|nr:hypothetical protein [Caulobacteraceae bacterium]